MNNRKPNEKTGKTKDPLVTVSVLNTALKREIGASEARMRKERNVSETGLESRLMKAIKDSQTGLESRLMKAIKDSETGLESKLQKEIVLSETKLRKEISGSESRLRLEIHSMDLGIRSDMRIMEERMKGYTDDWLTRLYSEMMTMFDKVLKNIDDLKTDRNAQYGSTAPRQARRLWTSLVVRGVHEPPYELFMNQSDQIFFILA